MKGEEEEEEEEKEEEEEEKGGLGRGCLKRHVAIFRTHPYLRRPLLTAVLNRGARAGAKRRSMSVIPRARETSRKGLHPRARARQGWTKGTEERWEGRDTE